ncbi:hypothetical protein CDL12_22590 [Handroanthus impetiginosus]|uniref:Uncharacterized protein n=1 Tax=Handroanthus impetiginosus TaxID=429701 RepID=A0A2G9GIM8_9LAMI|nr:hypothetical protein CDL12_22590 [Handroanthus impetiginosus]
MHKYLDRKKAGYVRGTTLTATIECLPSSSKPAFSCSISKHCASVRDFISNTPSADIAATFASSSEGVVIRILLPLLVLDLDLDFESLSLPIGNAIRMLRQSCVSRKPSSTTRHFLSFKNLKISRVSSISSMAQVSSFLSGSNCSRVSWRTFFVWKSSFMGTQAKTSKCSRTWGRWKAFLARVLLPMPLSPHMLTTRRLSSNKASFTLFSSI